jgi:hypothetical protein
VRRHAGQRQREADQRGHRDAVGDAADDRRRVPRRGTTRHDVSIVARADDVVDDIGVAGDERGRNAVELADLGRRCSADVVETGRPGLALVALSVVEQRLDAVREV